MVAEDVVWSVSDGSINSTGVFTPQLVGTHDVTACFGVICTTESITVTPGAPMTLVVEETSTTITADEFFTIFAHVEDQHGNEVGGELITYQVTNGSMQQVKVFWNPNCNCRLGHSDYRCNNHCTRRLTGLL